MKGLGLALLFAIGCIILFAAFGIGYGNWGELNNRIGIMQIIMVVLGVIVFVLAAAGVMNSGKARWTALVLGAVLLLGSSALVIFSVGWLIAPAALILLVFSIWKFRHVHISS